MTCRQNNSLELLNWCIDPMHPDDTALGTAHEGSIDPNLADMTMELAKEHDTWVNIYLADLGWWRNSLVWIHTRLESLDVGKCVSFFPRDFLMATVNTFVISHLLCRSNESWVQSHKNRMFKFFNSFFQTRWTYTSNTFKYNPTLKIWTLDCYVMCLHIYATLQTPTKQTKTTWTFRGTDSATKSDGISETTVPSRWKHPCAHWKKSPEEGAQSMFSELPTEMPMGKIAVSFEYGKCKYSLNWELAQWSGHGHGKAHSAEVLLIDQHFPWPCTVGQSWSSHIKTTHWPLKMKHIRDCHHGWTSAAFTSAKLYNLPLSNEFD